MDQPRRYALTGVGAAGTRAALAVNCATDHETLKRVAAALGAGATEPVPLPPGEQVPVPPMVQAADALVLRDGAAASWTGSTAIGQCSPSAPSSSPKGR